jgi:predicted porin
VAGAVLALGATAANAGIIIPAGDWTVDIGGNVNTFYTHTKYSGASAATKTNTLQTGLLPTALGIGAKTRQNDLDVAFQFSLFTGVNANGADSLNGGQTSGGLGYNSLNIRQAYLSFGDKSWGTILMGRNLGTFGSDAILSDMTLLGVGSNGGVTGSSTLGRIGSGYLYADWLAQVAYTTPNFNGLEATVSVHETLASQDNNELGYSGKASYSFAANDATGKVWVEGTTRKIQANGSGVFTERDSEAYGLGAKVGMAGAELVGYYYNGKNMDRDVGVAIPSVDTGNIVQHDNNGGYVQATYILPTKTKVGVSWGKNVIEKITTGTDNEREAWIVGAYHPITKHLNLVAEYNHLETTGTAASAFGGAEGKAKTMSLGAILFF